jgi:hypothetical protein
MSCYRAAANATVTEIQMCCGVQKSGLGDALTRRLR